MRKIGCGTKKGENVVLCHECACKGTFERCLAERVKKKLCYVFIDCELSEI